MPALLGEGLLLLAEERCAVLAEVMDAGGNGRSNLLQADGLADRDHSELGRVAPGALTGSGDALLDGRQIGGDITSFRLV